MGVPKCEEMYGMNIKILGSGCAKCRKLEKVVNEIVRDEGLDAVVEKVTELSQIMSYGVMRTPALVVDEKVVASGTIPKKDKIKQLLAR
jgi:small redox-active disulfide protein 2